MKASAVMHLGLRHPKAPPMDLIARLRDELPDVAISIDQDNHLEFEGDGSYAQLHREVVHTIRRVCPEAWGEHFRWLS